MIKLIASDMDGTLLDDKKQFPPDFFNLMDRLNRNNIKFVVASGRSFTALKPLFPNCYREMELICDNGAFIVINGKITSVSTISSTNINKTIDICNELDEVFPVLCGKKGIYISPEFEARSEEELGFYYSARTVCDNLKNTDDDIFKIALYDLKNPKNNSYPAMCKAFKDELELVISGSRWMDLMNKGISKGTALKEIQSLMNVSKSETMAFGDFYNDVDMLACAEYSYVMENAEDEMKQYGNYTAKNNNEYGVYYVIKDYLDRNGLV